jgi:hypothetical protein
MTFSWTGDRTPVAAPRLRAIPIALRCDINITLPGVGIGFLGVS